MKIIYIAGKYFGKTHNEVMTNMRVARIEAEFIWSRGAAAICPHLNSAWMGGCCDEENFYIGYLELVKKSDAIFALWNYKDSNGAKQEIKLAKEIGIPVLYSRVDLIKYLSKPDLVTDKT